MRIDTRDIKTLERHLEVFSKQGYPTAVRDGLNTAAFQTRAASVKNIREQMTTRNAWTVKSVQVTQAKIGPIDRMQSVIGSLADYMAAQEDGEARVAKGSQGVPIPTTYASGEGRGVAPRRRMPRKANRLSNVRLANQLPIANDRQRNAIAVKMAARGKGSKYVFLDVGRRKGIFRVTGTRKSIKVQMVYDLTRKSVKRPTNEWLKPATSSVGARMDDIMVRAMRFQAHKLGLFRR